MPRTGHDGRKYKHSRSVRGEKSSSCELGQVAPSHRVGWEAPRSPWTSARWWGRLQSRAGSACSLPGSWWYPLWAPQNPETAAYPPERQEGCLECDGHPIASAAEELAGAGSHICFWFVVAFVMFTSSITIIWTLSTFATPFLIKSSILPGVAMTTCTDLGKKIKIISVSLAGSWQNPNLSGCVNLGAVETTICWFTTTALLNYSVPHRSHPDAWCHLAGSCLLWWPWPSLLPGACWAGWRSGSSAAPARGLAPWQELWHLKKQKTKQTNK